MDWLYFMIHSVTLKFHFSASVTFSTARATLAVMGRTENPGSVWGWDVGYKEKLWA